VVGIYNDVFGEEEPWSPSLPFISVADKNHLIIANNGTKLVMPIGSARSRCEVPLMIMASQSRIVHKLLACVKCDLLPLLVGDSNCGKRSMVEVVAALLRQHLQSLRLSSTTDAMELLGSYEQVSTILHQVGYLLIVFILQIVDGTDFEDQRRRLIEFCSDDSSIEMREIVERASSCRNFLDLQSLIQQAAVLSESSEGWNLLPIFPFTQSDYSDYLDLAALAQETAETKVRFQWVRSELVKAYSEGHWILIEDVNCCR